MDPPSTIGKAAFNLYLLRIDRVRGRVLVRHDDAEPLWISIPSRVTLRAEVDVGAAVEVESMTRASISRQP